MRLVFLVIFVVLSGIGLSASRPELRAETSAEPSGQSSSIRVLRSFPHNPEHWTEGLEMHQGLLIEGTGGIDQTKIEKVDPETGKVVSSVRIPKYYGEGITIFGNKLIQLTYTELVGLVYDFSNMKKTATFKLETDSQEGWGLTHDANNLIMSDGSSKLYYLDPKSYKTVRTLQVTDRGEPVFGINELEYVDGKIYANIWTRNDIIVISAKSGEVLKRYDGSSLQRLAGGARPYLNGIAFDSSTGHFYVTGKQWSKFFEVIFE